MTQIGEIRIFAYNYAPVSYLFCDGRQYEISRFPDLFSVIGTRYGGDGVNTFAVPDLRSRIPIHIGSGPRLSPRSIGQTGGSEKEAVSVAQMAAHAHQISGGEAPATDRVPTSTNGLAESQGRIYGLAEGVAMSPQSVSNTGSTAPHQNLQPFLTLNFCMAYEASRYGNDDQFAAEIRMFAGNYAPKGWALCDGQVVAIHSNTPLFALMGTAYGGNGFTTFVLPDLRGRAPMGPGHDDNLTPHFIGDSGGSQTVTLTTDNLPAHAHGVTASNAVALSNDPAGKTLGVPFSGDNLYAPPGGPQTGLTGTIGSTGDGQPHNNMQPYLAVNYIICLEGVWPARP